MHSGHLIFDDEVNYSTIELISYLKLAWLGAPFPRPAVPLPRPGASLSRPARGHAQAARFAVEAGQDRSRADGREPCPSAPSRVGGGR
jgi:hypothetical protein